MNPVLNLFFMILNITLGIYNVQQGGDFQLVLACIQFFLAGVQATLIVEEVNR